MSAIQCLGGVLHGELFEYTNGPTVPVEAMNLLAELDVRGIHVQQNGERLRVYRDDDATPPLLVTLTPGKDKVKVVTV